MASHERELQKFLAAYRDITSLRVEDLQSGGSHIRSGSLTVTEDDFFENLYYSDRKLEESLKSAIEKPVSDLVLLLGKLGSGKSSLIRKFISESKNGVRDVGTEEMENARKEDKAEENTRKNFLIDFRSANDFGPLFGFTVNTPDDEKEFRYQLTKGITTAIIAELNMEEISRLGLKLISEDLLSKFKVSIPLQELKELRDILANFLLEKERRIINGGEFNSNSDQITLALRQYITHFLSKNFKVSQLGRALLELLEWEGVNLWFDNTDRLPPKTFRILVQHLSRATVDLPHSATLIVAAREETLANAMLESGEFDESGRTISGGEIMRIYVAPSSLEGTQKNEIFYKHREEDFTWKFKMITSSYFNRAQEQARLSQEIKVALGQLRNTVDQEIWMGGGGGNSFAKYLNYSIRDGLYEDAQFFAFLIENFVDSADGEAILNELESLRQLDKHRFLTIFLAYASSGIERVDPLLGLRTDFNSNSITKEFLGIAGKVTQHITIQQGELKVDIEAIGEGLKDLNPERNTNLVGNANAQEGNTIEKVLAERLAGTLSNPNAIKALCATLSKLGLLLKLRSVSARAHGRISEISMLISGLGEIGRDLLSDLRSLGRLPGRGEGAHEFVLFHVNGQGQLDFAAIAPRGQFYLDYLSKTYAYTLVTALRFTSENEDDSPIHSIRNYIGSKDKEDRGGFLYSSLYIFLLGVMLLMTTQDNQQTEFCRGKHSVEMVDAVADHFQDQIRGVGNYLTSRKTITDKLAEKFAELYGTNTEPLTKKLEQWAEKWVEGLRNLSDEVK